MSVNRRSIGNDMEFERIMSDVYRARDFALPMINKAKVETSRILGQLDTVNDPLLQRLRPRINDCGNWVRGFVRDDGTVGLAGCFCKQFWLCQVCAMRRVYRVGREVAHAVVAALRADVTLVPVYLTLTVRSGNDVVERVECLRQSLSRLYERARDTRRGRCRGGEAVKIVGCVELYDFYDCTPSEIPYVAHQFHPHAHVIALVRGTIQLNRLSREWRILTRGSHHVHKRPIDKWNPVRIDAPEFIAEVMKATRYGTRFLRCVPTFLRWRIFSALKYGKSRLPYSVVARGILRGRGISPDLTDEDDSGDSGSIEMFAARWTSDGYSLSQT